MSDVPTTKPAEERVLKSDCGKDLTGLHWELLDFYKSILQSAGPFNFFRILGGTKADFERGGPWLDRR